MEELNWLTIINNRISEWYILLEFSNWDILEISADTYEEYWETYLRWESKIIRDSELDHNQKYYLWKMKVEDKIRIEQEAQLKLREERKAQEKIRDMETLSMLQAKYNLS